MRKFFLLLIVFINIMMGTSFAKTLAYIPNNPTRALVIIHGYGGDGHRMKWMTDYLKKEIPDMAFYYPTAPDRAITGGYQWFMIPMDIDKIREKSSYDKMMKDAIKNLPVLHQLVDDIHKDLHMPYENIYIAGFSQGGLMALLTALTNSHNMQVAVSLSGVPLLFTDDFTTNSVKGNPDMLLIQGSSDDVIPKESIKMTADTLQKLQIEPSIQMIKGLSHQINNQALRYMIDFIK